MADIKVRIIAEDKATDVLKQTGKAVDDAGKKAKEAGGAFEGMGKIMASIAGGLGLQMGLQAVVGGLKNAVVGSFELAAALETTKVGFTTMLGNSVFAQDSAGNRSGGVWSSYVPLCIFDKNCVNFRDFRGCGPDRWYCPRN